MISLANFPSILSLSIKNKNQKVTFSSSLNKYTLRMKKEIEPYTILFSISNLQQLDLKVQYIADNCKISIIPVPGLLLCKYRSNGNFKFLTKADSNKNLYKFGLQTPQFSIGKTKFSFAFQLANTKDLKIKTNINDQKVLFTKTKIYYNIPKNSISKYSYNIYFKNLLQNDKQDNTIIISENYNYNSSNSGKISIYFDQYKQSSRFRQSFSISHNNFILGISKTYSYKFGTIKFSGMIDSTIKPRIKLHFDFE